MNEPNAYPGLSRKIQLIEIGVFLLLVLPSMALSFISAPQAQLPFTYFAVAQIMQLLALAGLVLYFVWRNREPFDSIGWTFENAGKEAFIGILLFFPILLGLGLLEKLLKAAGISPPQQVPEYLVPEGMPEKVLAGVLLVVVAVCEELIFRGYLLRRLINLTGNLVAGVLIAAVVFSIGHGYQQIGGVIATGVLGAIFAIIFLWRGSLVAPITIHFMNNFTMIFFIALYSGNS